MARIKYVINERRLAYEGAVQIFRERVRRRLTRREKKRKEHKQYLAEKARQKESEKKKTATEKVHHSDGANMAAAGLFGQAQSTETVSSESATIVPRR